MKILVIGHRGMLAQELLSCLANADFAVLSWGRPEVDITQATEMVYKVSAEYAPESEAGILWNDPDIAIPWPIEAPVLSRKDAQLPLLRDLQAVFFYHQEPTSAATPRQEGQP